ncbi:hypothetical protein C5S29_08130 [ANME-1 cluster archaeon GoMg3.2]|nr:hypothetical protein [ANME-1 cluster archaeon GoMg3.2]
MEVASRIAFAAIPSIRGNPTAEHAGGNACVVSSQNNVGNPRTQLRSTARIRPAIPSVMRTIVRVVNYDKRKRTDTLKPKGMESDHNGWHDVMGGGRMIPGLKMGSKAFIVICGAELGKPYMLPENPGRDTVRANDGIVGRGTGKKRITSCNEAYKGSKFALTRKGADLLKGVSLYVRRQNVSSSITPIKVERLTDIQPKFR